MKKSILGNLDFSLNAKTLIPIAAGFLFAPSFLYSQNSVQIKEIQKRSNLKELGKLSQNFKRNTLTIKQLKTKAKQLNVPFSGKSNGKYFQLQGFTKKGYPLYYITHNEGAAIGTGVNKLRPGAGYFNLEGTGMTVYEWDGGGVLTSHQEFQNRVTQIDQPNELSDHATHVAGTMVAAGVDPLAKGMAPKARLNAYDWNSDEDEMTEAAINGALLSNHSYGYNGGFVYNQDARAWLWMGDDEDTEFKGWGQYSEFDKNWDLIALNAPFYLPVKAAGNPRGDGPEPGGVHYVYDPATRKWKQSTKVRQKNGGDDGFDSVLFGATGKNILVVGAAHKIDKGYQKPSDVTMASFSGFGPTDDGRIKPDISGIGVGLHSSISSGDDKYGVLSGTSMASPNITGSLLLLQEHYKNVNGSFMKAATLKALAIATANEAGENPGPDYASGWGLLNAYEGAKAITLNGKYSLIQEKSLQNHQSNEIEVTASGNEPLKVTIVWADPVPEQLSDEDKLNDRTPMLVNDLDIRVVKVGGDGTEFMPWKLDPEHPANAATKGDNVVDNVEQVVIDNPEAGAKYKIIISHKGDLKKNTVALNDQGENVTKLVGTSSQDYSIVINGINEGVKKDLALTAVTVNADRANYTQETPIIFAMDNVGTESVSGAKLFYELIEKGDSGNKTVASGLKDIPAIARGANTEVVVNLDLSKSFVDYTIKGKIVYSEDQIDINNDAQQTAYGILADLTPDDSKHYFGYEDNMEKNGWTSEDIDKDGRTWIEYSSARLAHSGSSFAVNFPNNKSTDDWIFSNPLKLKKDVLYRVVFYGSKFQALDEAISVAIGNEPKSAAMTKVLASDVKASNNGEYNRYSYEFKVDSDQVAYIGFHHKSADGENSYAYALDDVTFEHAEGKPSVEFKADKLKANSFETISFSNSTIIASTQEPATYKWTFTPSTVTYQDGTTDASKEPKVVFNEQGTYSVKLTATNSVGLSDFSEKQDYIVIKNTNTKANFKLSSSSIFEDETVTFTNTSTGNPAPDEFKWTITPSEGVSYVGDTKDSDASPTVKFSKSGIYTVSLMAKSPYNSDTKVVENAITVNSLHAPVRNLAYTREDKDVKLTWDRPIMLPVFEEGFEGEEEVMPADYTILNENEDEKTWQVGKAANSGIYGAVSFSWYLKPLTPDDWLITPKISGGAENVKFFLQNPYAERYDVYLVEAPASGALPSLDELKQGHILLTDEAATINKSFVEKSFDIKELGKKDFFLAFHHRTKKTDNSFYLAIDDISIGYDNSTNSDGSNTRVRKVSLAPISKPSLDYKAMIKEGKEIISMKELEQSKSVEAINLSTKKEFGATNLPKLLGYQVERNGESVEYNTDYNKKYYDDTLSQNGTYTYDVYALYSDGKTSEKRTVIIDIQNLSTSETSANDRLKVYPNPSDGRFTVEGVSDVTGMKAAVYDMSGKQILSNDFKGNKFNLNLLQYPKGVYILNVVDNNGKRQNVKLIIK
ncbi:S8 family serine peptidase [Riemerella columbipharyngis]|uniref:Por secretion system C-terminal sorting domain-containing protein n=1 Tax=Riemerella columbipharyngis TaxID=1071918 RepID=A0A1G6ZTM0_9FLAO|nr:S8 family serine peptidase [Riemerella columbipharyngis]SDE05899.1 Por secretion system C-terminal sorting domain-containing protein [Riemerella columbipharyngis]